MAELIAFFDTAPAFEAWETHRYLKNRLGNVRATKKETVSTIFFHHIFFGRHRVFRADTSVKCGAGVLRLPEESHAQGHHGLRTQGRIRRVSKVRKKKP